MEPLAHFGQPLVTRLEPPKCVPLGLCGKLLSSPTQVDCAGSSQFVDIYPSPSDRDPRRGVVSIPLGQGGGFKSPCYLTASPPIPLPIYGANAANIYRGGAVNTYIRGVPNRLPYPFWQSLHLMEISKVFTATFAPTRPMFTAPHMRTMHPKLVVPTHTIPSAQKKKSWAQGIFDNKKD